MCVTVIDSLYLSFLSWMEPSGVTNPYRETPNLPCFFQAFLSQRRVTDKALSTVPSVQPCSVYRVQHWEAGLPAMEAGPQVTEVRVR